MFLAGASALALTGSATAADDAQRLLTIDH
jgi:hypothetical protein